MGPKINEMLPVPSVWGARPPYTLRGEFIVVGGLMVEEPLHSRGIYIKVARGGDPGTTNECSGGSVQKRGLDGIPGRWVVCCFSRRGTSASGVS